MANKPGRPAFKPRTPFALWLAGRQRAKVAKQLKVSLATISRLSLGTSQPSLSLALRIEKLTDGVVGASSW